MNLQLYFDGCMIKEHGTLIRFGTADRRWQPHTLSIINPFQEVESQCSFDTQGLS